MENELHSLKIMLLNAVDRNSNVTDDQAISKVLEILEVTHVDEISLRATRIGKIVNDIRRTLKDETLATRAKNLVRRWRNSVLCRDVKGGSHCTQVHCRNNYDSYEIKPTKKKCVTCGIKVVSNFETKLCERKKEFLNALRLTCNNGIHSSSFLQDVTSESFRTSTVNGNTNQFEQGKDNNLSTTIYTTDETPATQNTMKSETAQIYKSISRLQEQKKKVLFSRLQNASYKPRKKVKTTQELIRTILKPHVGEFDGCDLKCSTESSGNKQTSSEGLKQFENNYTPEPVNPDKAVTVKNDDNAHSSTELGSIYERKSVVPVTVQFEVRERISDRTINQLDSALPIIEECKTLATVEENNLLKDLTETTSVDNGNEKQFPEVSNTILSNDSPSVTSTCILSAPSSNVAANANLPDPFNQTQVNGVTGMKTDDGFKEWHECIYLRTYNGELLTILPYVIID